MNYRRSSEINELWILKNSKELNCCWMMIISLKRTVVTFSSVLDIDNLSYDILNTIFLIMLLHQHRCYCLLWTKLAWGHQTYNFYGVLKDRIVHSSYCQARKWATLISLWSASVVINHQRLCQYLARFRFSIATSSFNASRFDMLCAFVGNFSTHAY